MPRRKSRKGSHFRNIPIDHVVNHSEVLLRQIKQRLGHVISFTREDLIRLPTIEFEQVAFITRHRATCVAVAYLIEKGLLIQKKFPDLCLPDRAGDYRFDETSVSIEYAETIRRLVNTMPTKRPFAVMQVVQRWRTDPQLTQDTKRKAVRNALRRLAREGICDRLNDFEYAIGGAP